MSTRVISFRGVRWEVLEAPRTVADDVDRTALYFLSRAGTRRSDQFPGDWEHLSSQELTDMCASARTLHEHAAFAPAEAQATI